MFRKIPATIALLTGLLLVGATPAQASVANANPITVVGMSEQDAYDYLDKRNIPYLLITKEIYQNTNCTVVHQSIIEPDWVAWLRGFIGSVALPVPTKLGLVVACDGAPGRVI